MKEDLNLLMSNFKIPYLYHFYEKNIFIILKPLVFFCYARFYKILILTIIKILVLKHEVM